jgi:hypothetical protein
LISNPRRLSEELTRSDRKALRAREEMLDPQHPCWLVVDDAETGIRALNVLSGT